MHKKINSQKRQNRVRKSLKAKSGGKARRLSIFVSNKNIFAQIINDLEGFTLVSASSSGLKDSLSKELAQKVAVLLAKEAKNKGILEVIFDRGSRRYHGIVKEFAETMRKEGIKI
jgi:large subunit ribosomal protein L18